MSGYRSQRGRFSGHRGRGRMKSEVGSHMEWKPKPKIITDGSMDNVSRGQSENASLTGECTSGQMNHRPDSDGSKQPENLLPVFNGVASGIEKLTRMPDSPQTEDSSSKLSEHSYKHPSTANTQTGRSLEMVDEIYQMMAGSGSRGSDDSDCGSIKYRYDIYTKQSDSLVKLKAPLHVRNREKRNEMKRSVEGQNIMVLRPGMVLLKSYISKETQIKIVKKCRELGNSEGGFYQPGYRDGATLHLKMMCLGRNWDPQSGKYGDTRPVDNTKPPCIPDEFHNLVKRAIQDSHAHIQKNSTKADPGKIIPFISPNICIVNFYTKGGKLGLHQDKDESVESLDKGLPVVSFSIGESAEFLYGDVRDIDKADKVVLESGDVLIFGGKSRHIFHGVASILAGTSPTSLLEATNLQPGRLNLTFREF